MNRDQIAERNRLLKELFSAFPSTAGSTETAKVYLRVLEPFDNESLAEAVDKFITGHAAPHNGRFVPSTAELVPVVEQIAFARREKELLRLYGPASYVDFGHGRIDLRGLSPVQKDMVMRLGGKLPDGRNLARLTIEDRQKVLTKKSLAELEKSARNQITTDTHKRVELKPQGFN